MMEDKLPEHASGSYFFPPYITLAHLFHAPDRWGIASRRLSTYQFQYTLDGIAEYEIEGRTIVTRKGDLIYHSPYQLHEVRTLPNQPYICLSLLFHFGGHEYPIQELLGEDRYVGNFSGTDIEKKLTQLIARYRQPGIANHAVCQGLLMQLFGEIAQWKHDAGTVSDGQQKIKTKMALIRNYITANYMNAIRHEDLEQLSGVSRNYVILKFKQFYGMTPFDYLLAIRIERAKELALQTGMSVGEIALAVGYADVHTFGRMFKSKMGVSLSQFCSAIVPGDLPRHR